MSYLSQIARLSALAIFAFLLFVLSDVAGQSTDSENGKSANVRAQYARKSLQLAELELAIVLEANEEIPNLHTPRTIQRLRNNVAYAEEALRYETESDEKDLHDLHLHELEVDLKTAQTELAAATKLNQRLPGSLNDLEIKKLRATTEVARLALALARDPAVIQSREDHFQWQIDRMRSEMTRLYILMDKALPRN